MFTDRTVFTATEPEACGPAAPNPCDDRCASTRSSIWPSDSRPSPKLAPAAPARVAFLAAGPKSSTPAADEASAAGEEDVDVAWAWAMAWAPNLSRLSWTQPVVDLMANLSRAVSFGGPR